MSYDKNQKWWYVGAMNDALFVIDAPPRPSTDSINPDQPNVNVIAALGNYREAAELLAREHNEKVSLLKIRELEGNPPGAKELLANISPGRWGYDLNGHVAIIDDDLEWGATLFKIPGKTTPELTDRDHANGEFVARAPAVVKTLLGLLDIHSKESAGQLEVIQQLLVRVADLERENTRLRKIAVDLEHDFEAAVKYGNEVEQAN